VVNGTQPRFVHDLGSEFVNREVATVIKTHNLISVNLKPRYRGSNGIVERFNDIVRDECDNEERRMRLIGYMRLATLHRRRPGWSSRRACEANSPEAVRIEERPISGDLPDSLRETLIQSHVKRDKRQMRFVLEVLLFGMSLYISVRIDAFLTCGLFNRNVVLAPIVHLRHVNPGVFLLARSACLGGFLLRMPN
jgi:hypothetical protein